MNPDLILRESHEKLQLSSESLLSTLWQRFNTEFPTAEDCLDELCKRASDDGILKCRHCGSAEFSKGSGCRLIICRDCRKPTWLTAGTFFHHVRLPRAWLGAIWLMERGASISACRFHKLAGIAYSTAWSIFHKLSTVIKDAMGVSAKEVPSSLFGSLVCRRSRETPARAHPLAEQDEIESSNRNPGGRGLCSGVELHTWTQTASVDVGLQPAFAIDPQVDSAGMRAAGLPPSQPPDCPDLSPQEKKIYELMAAQELHFDVLCAGTGLPAGELSSLLIIMELGGLIRRRAGDRYVRSVDDCTTQHRRIGAQLDAGRDAIPPEAKALVERIINFVRGHYQAISRKYLQNYLAAYWCHADRRRWCPGALLKACFRFGPVRSCDIGRYVSPLLVKIAP